MSGRVESRGRDREGKLMEEKSGGGREGMEIEDKLMKVWRREMMEEEKKTEVLEL